MTPTSRPASTPPIRPAPGPAAPASPFDQLLLLTVGVSMVGHILAVGAFLITSKWGLWTHALTTPVKLVYEQESSPDQAPWTQEVARIQVGLREPPAPSAVLPQHSGADGYHPGPLGPDMSHLAAHEAGEGFGVEWVPSAASDSGEWGSAVDLTNLTQAFQGNPVLYGYFSAIRERIQGTANDQPWMPSSAASSGVVYVGFVLNRTGELESASVISDRSDESPLLQEVALRIVKASGPFLPFPPSFPESSKAIVVPIEFSSGS